MAKKKAIKKPKIKKKKWFEIVSPQLLKGEVIGEGYAESPEALIGRTINASLADIFKSGSKRHMSVKLKVDNVKTSTAHTIIKEIVVSAPYLFRKTRKNSKISGRFIGDSSDGVKLDVRVSAIAQGHCLTTAKKDIRKKLNESIEKFIKKTKKDGVIMDLINNNFQKKIKRGLHKIHPMRTVELEKIVVK